jgi:hypothetical protein
MSLEELSQMAHGGQPEAAAASQRGFTSISATLRQVSRTINEPLSVFGMGWDGQASQAAQAGISQHSRWAEQAAARASTTAGQAGQYYTSAKNVIANMPDPASAPGASGGAAGATDLAAVEQAKANAKQRAIELMQGHADVCQQAAPKTGFAPPPTEGAVGGVARAAVNKNARNCRSVARATPPGGAAEAAPAPESSGATTTAGAVQQPSPAGRAGAAVAAGTEGELGSVRGYQPGAVGETVPAGAGFLPAGTGRTRGGRILAAQGVGEASVRMPALSALAAGSARYPMRYRRARCRGRRGNTPRGVRRCSAATATRSTATVPISVPRRPVSPARRAPGTRATATTPPGRPA